MCKRAAVQGRMTTPRRATTGVQAPIRLHKLASQPPRRLMLEPRQKCPDPPIHRSPQRYPDQVTTIITDPSVLPPVPVLAGIGGSFTLFIQLLATNLWRIVVP